VCEVFLLLSSSLSPFLSRLIFLFISLLHYLPSFLLSMKCFSFSGRLSFSFPISVFFLLNFNYISFLSSSLILLCYIFFTNPIVSSSFSYLLCISLFLISISFTTAHFLTFPTIFTSFYSFLSYLLLFPFTSFLFFFLFVFRKFSYSVLLLTISLFFFYLVFLLYFSVLFLSPKSFSCCFMVSHLISLSSLCLFLSLPLIPCCRPF